MNIAEEIERIYRVQAEARGRFALMVAARKLKPEQVNYVADTFEKCAADLRNLLSQTKRG